MEDLRLAESSNNLYDKYIEGEILEMKPYSTHLVPKANRNIENERYGPVFSNAYEHQSNTNLEEEL